MSKNITELCVSEIIQVNGGGVMGYVGMVFGTAGGFFAGAWGIDIMANMSEYCSGGHNAFGDPEGTFQIMPLQEVLLKKVTAVPASMPLIVSSAVAGGIVGRQLFETVFGS